MPWPSPDPVFRWEYTLLGDGGFDDGRKPSAATLACHGVPFPQTVVDAARPTHTPGQSGPWWITQDLALHENLVSSTLRVSSWFGMMPVLSPRHLNAARDIEIVSTHTIRVPARHRTSDNKLQQQVRRCIRDLIAQTDEQSAELILASLADALEQMCDPEKPNETRTARIALTRFPHRPWLEGPSTPRLYPVIVYTPYRPTPPETPAASSAATHQEGSANFAHPIQHLINEVEAGDRAAFDAYLADPSVDADRLYSFAEMFAARQNIDLAEAAWHKADELGSKDAPVELAHILLGRGDHHAAEGYAERADNRGSPRGSHLHGLLLQQRGDNAGAEAAFGRGDERGNGSASLELGLILQRRGSVAEAAAAFARADDRGQARAATAIGIQLAELGDLDQAEAAWQRGDARGDALAAYLLGNQAARRNELDRAEAAWQRAAERGSVSALPALARLYLARDDQQAAERVLRAGDDGGDGESALLLGLILDDSAQADAALDRAMRRGKPAAARILGERCQNRGDHKGAKRAWQAGADLGDAAAAMNLASLHLGEHDLASAMPLLEVALASDDPQVASRAAITFAWILRAADDLDGAETILRNTVECGVPELAEHARKALAEIEAARRERAETGTHPSV